MITTDAKLTVERTEHHAERSTDWSTTGAFDVTTTVTGREVYLGRTIELVSVYCTEHTFTSTITPYGQTEPVTRTDIQGGYTRTHCAIDGRTFRRPAGTDAQVFAKLRKGIDTDVEDAAMLADLKSLIGVQPDAHVAVGAIGSVYAMGRSRTGRIISETKTGYMVAYTTASSNGRVFRKRVAK